MHFVDQLVAKQLLVIFLLSASLVPAVSAANRTTGKATVYADSFNGKKTATGATYKKNGVSVASNKFPLGSKVMVKNKKTGKTILARVNDRMGKNSAAVVDLSKGAAKKLGVKGTASVDAKVVSKKSK
ncbi:hypothetical protein BH10CYA1_BH10CYA1_54700 [soil metagenome]